MTTADVAAPARSRGLALLQALRPHQWVKNLLVFVPVVLDHKLFDAETMAKAGHRLRWPSAAPPRAPTSSTTSST